MKSTELIQPLAMPAALSYAGEKNTIPTNSIEGSNAASISEGFPAITSLPKKEGGLPPARKDFNGMFYLSTDQKVFLQNGGIITFSQEVSDAIGGYPKNAVLDYIDSSDTYHKVQSLIDNNTYNFVTTPSYIDDEHWKEIRLGGGDSRSPIGRPIICLPEEGLGINEIWLEGAEVSKTTYAQLYAIYGDSYGTPAVETNFVLPDFRCRTLWGSEDRSSGYIEAGLPNITGVSNRFMVYGEDTTSSGAMNRTAGISKGASGNNTAGFNAISFNAHWSNPIYNDDTRTVQPASIKIRVKTRYQ